MSIWCQNDVVSSSMRRHDVASTLNMTSFYVMFSLGQPLLEDTASLFCGLIDDILYICFLGKSSLIQKSKLE